MLTDAAEHGPTCVGGDAIWAGILTGQGWPCLSGDETVVSGPSFCVLP
jgi:hypothetical protein